MATKLERCIRQVKRKIKEGKVSKKTNPFAVCKHALRKK